jgi:hypothetical protein
VRVKRVRGKKILLLPLIAMFLSVMFMGNPALAAPKTTLYLDPALLPGPGQTGMVGDEFWVSVMIKDAADVWAVQFTVTYAPYVSVLTASEFTEGTFMSDGGTHPTMFFYTVDTFHGEFTAVILRTGAEPRVGASGDGELLTFKFKVIEAGSCPLGIEDSILLNSDGYQISHNTIGGFYQGTSASLIRVNLPDGRKVTAGDTFTICPKVRNDGEEKVNVTVRFDLVRLEDGRQIQIRAGQTYTGGGLGEPLPYEYLYLDEFNEWYYEFTGDPLNALGEPDGLYIEGNADAQWASSYSFEDIDLAGKEIANIWVEGYTRYPNGFTEGVDIDLYGLPAFAWWGSCYGTSDWGWHGTRWIDGESVLQQEPYLADEATLNAAELLIYNYLGDAPDVIQIDSMRLKVEFAAITPVIADTYELLPGQELELPCVTWLSNIDHAGTYELTATIEYTSDFFSWNSWASKQKTLTFWIVP